MRLIFLRFGFSPAAGGAQSAWHGAFISMEAPFLLLGLCQGKSRIPKHLAAFLIAGLLVAPIPERYHAGTHVMRAYTEIPIMQLIEALGAWVLISKLKKAVANICPYIGHADISRGSKILAGILCPISAEQSIVSNMRSEEPCNTG